MDGLSIWLQITRNDSCSCWWRMLICVLPASIIFPSRHTRRSLRMTWRWFNPRQVFRCLPFKIDVIPLPVIHIMFYGILSLVKINTYNIHPKACIQKATYRFKEVNETEYQPDFCSLYMTYFLSITSLKSIEWNVVSFVVANYCVIWCQRDFDWGVKILPEDFLYSSTLCAVFKSYKIRFWILLTFLLICRFSLDLFVCHNACIVLSFRCK